MLCMCVWGWGMLWVLDTAGAQMRPMLRWTGSVDARMALQLARLIARNLLRSFKVWVQHTLVDFATSRSGRSAGRQGRAAARRRVPAGSRSAEAAAVRSAAPSTWQPVAQRAMLAR